MALSLKQQRFVDEYLVSGNATQAAIAAGYSEKTARSIGAENLTKPDIAAVIASRQLAAAEKADVSAEQVLRALAAIAFADLTDVASWGEDGELSMVGSSELSPAAAAALREIRSTTSTVTFGDGGERSTVYKAVKQHDKLRALELLGKHLGMFSEKFEVSHTGLAEVFELIHARAKGQAAG